MRFLLETRARAIARRPAGEQLRHDERKQSSWLPRYSRRGGPGGPPARASDRGPSRGPAGRYAGRAADALASEVDEGRGKQRYAPGRRRRPSIRGCPNGGTRAGSCPRAPARIHRAGGTTRGTETSKYPEEEKSTEIPGVAASETGPAQTADGAKPGGVAAAGSWDRDSGDP